MAKDTNARVTHWFLALQDYYFQVVHRPGRAHANADALSRRDACLGLCRGVPDLWGCVATPIRWRSLSPASALSAGR